MSNIITPDGGAPKEGDLVPIQVAAPLLIMGEVVSVNPIIEERAEGPIQKVMVKYLHPMAAQWMQREVEIDVGTKKGEAQPLIITN